jgi:hypothetical protein
VARSERLNKLGDSWFSSKAIEVVPCELLVGGRALCRLGGRDSPTKPMQTPNTNKAYHRRHTAGDKVRREKGKSPDRQLRSQNYS